MPLTELRARQMRRLTCRLVASVLNSVDRRIVGPSMTNQDWPVSLLASGSLLHGSLRRAAASPTPVALIIAGSGPTDRDGNSAALPGRNDSLLLLAEALADAGIASLRYDKRGIAVSAAAAPAEIDLRFDTYVQDATDWIRLLSADSRFGPVAVIGHSEGSLIGMIAARLAGADAFVSIAGAARCASEIIREQLRGKLGAALEQRSDQILGALERGESVDAVPAELMMLYRRSAQPYLMSWLRHTPTEELQRLSMPVLIAQGNTDLQIDVADAMTLHAARPGSTLAIIDGMNHVLKRVARDSADAIKSYSDPDLPIARELVDTIAAFLLK
jgi:pimeloyl-ACP methyl ester carboxylesterase